jgi:hypothetical protein
MVVVLDIVMKKPKKPSVTLICQWLIMTRQCFSAEMFVKGFKMCCISSAVDGTDDMLWKGSEEDGNVRSECEKMKALTVKGKTVTLIGKGR